MLEVKGISVGYKELLAVQDVSFSVRKGEVVSLVGSNGAGKSTILRAISGLLRPKRGEILLNGEPIHKTPPYEIVRKKIAMVPEGRQLFGRLSVLDNLLLGAYVLDAKEEVSTLLESVLALFPRLAERKGQRAETLSGGEQQQLAIGRGLMSRPPSHAGRAVPRHHAEADVRDLQDYPRDQPEGSHRLPGRAERVRGPGHFGQGVRAADRTHRPGGQGQGSLEVRLGSESVPWNVGRMSRVDLWTAERGGARHED